MTIGAVVILAGTIGRKAVPNLHLEQFSQSVPLGLYRLRTASRLLQSPNSSPFSRPSRWRPTLDLKWLPAGQEFPMLKRVLALPGQTICRNGTHYLPSMAIEMGEARERDSAWPAVAGLGRVSTSSTTESSSS